MSTESNPVDDGKMLQDALGVVKTQTIQMKRSLDVDQIMEALKSASTMLAELRTSSLSPKQYYELYMSVFDALRFLTNYLYEAHTTGKHHLADLYELVQYAGNIVPRLYLMITVGSVYMSIPDAPVKEIMKDMLEMSRGVQHPTRGLFLRHYLSGQTRDYLPVGDSPGADGNLQDSIAFVLTNFVEMNKLWVRLQHQGHSRERERREAERKELRILVGTNLVRLSQLEGVDLQMYQQAILPSIMEQVVGCRDIIAQEYLMEVVIQVFTDDFHLHTLDVFLGATAQLQTKVNVKQIVIALIDRLASYAAREAENESIETRKAKEEAAVLRLAARVREARDRISAKATSETLSTTIAMGTSMSIASDRRDAADTFEPKDGTTPHSGAGSTSAQQTYATSTGEKTYEGTEDAVADHFRGIPATVRLFEIFWLQVVELLKARSDLSIQDITALLVSLVHLALSCYPDRLEYVEQIFAFALDTHLRMAENPEILAPETVKNLLALLIAPVSGYESALTLLAIHPYHLLLKQQPFSTRSSIAQAIVASILRHGTVIETPSDISGILDLCSVLVSLPGGKTSSDPSPVRGLDNIIEVAEEQGWLARMVHLLRAEDASTNFELLSIARDRFGQGGPRIIYTFPAVVAAALKLTRHADLMDKDSSQLLNKLFKFVHVTVSRLYTSVEASDVSLRLYLLSAQFAGQSGMEEVAYEFFVQAFTIYEESISDSHAQTSAINAIISALQTSRAFGAENYDTLITKAALHASKLLKKPHQAIAVLNASHMWWQGEVPGSEDGPKTGSRDGKRVLECLQKALRIASSCIDETQSVRLYIDALDRYVCYFEQGVEAISPKYINSLSELITSNMDLAAPSDAVLSTRGTAADRPMDTLDIVKHFRNTLEYMHIRRSSAAPDGRSQEWQSIDLQPALSRLSEIRAL